MMKILPVAKRGRLALHGKPCSRSHRDRHSARRGVTNPLPQEVRMNLRAHSADGLATAADRGRSPGGA